MYCIYDLIAKELPITVLYDISFVHLKSNIIMLSLPKLH